MVNLTAVFSTLITANHILHYHKVLDAYGHISVRNPNNNLTFFLSKNIAPALVSSPEDLVEYYVSNASSVDPNAPAGYIERYIHSEVLKRFPEVNSVIHSHSEAVIPYSDVDVPLEPLIHMAGFLGPQVPNFEIEDYYNSTEPHDLLIRTQPLGAALAAMFSVNPKEVNISSVSNSPNHTLVLQRGHGFTTLGPTVELAVFRAIYAQTNAVVQAGAIALASLADRVGQPGGWGEVKYLSARERVDTHLSIEPTSGRPWQLWVREVETYPGGLYVNVLGTPPGA